MPGPSYETSAEARLARQLGADVIGMAIAPEAIIARSPGLRVGALAIVTNFAAGFSGGNPNREEIKRAALSGTIGLKRLTRDFIKTRDQLRLSQAIFSAIFRRWRQ
ncbi:MAG: hypothetical protein J2P49_09555 [Methylocapsa sp.]|nr:hypothetical protein [Methylocapsa sp.]